MVVGFWFFFFFSFPTNHDAGDGSVLCKQPTKVHLVPASTSLVDGSVVSPPMLRRNAVMPSSSSAACCAADTSSAVATVPPSVRLQMEARKTASSSAVRPDDAKDAEGGAFGALRLRMRRQRREWRPTTCVRVDGIEMNDVSRAKWKRSGGASSASVSIVFFSFWMRKSFDCFPSRCVRASGGWGGVLQRRAVTPQLPMWVGHPQQNVWVGWKVGLLAFSFLSAFE